MPEPERDETEPGYVIGPTSGAPDVELTGARGATGSPHSDEEIQAEVRARFAASSLADQRLDVRVVNRTVTLSGTVPDAAAKHLAEHIGESVAGVREVRSAIEIAAPRDRP